MAHAPARGAPGAPRRRRPRALLLLFPLLLATLIAGCAAPGGDPAPVETDHVEAAEGWAFEPQAIRVAVGATVTWTNTDSVPHTVTFEGLGVDVELAPGEATNHTFTAAGEFDYVCEFHTPDMVGTVIVVAAGGDGNGTAS